MSPQLVTSLMNVGLSVGRGVPPGAVQVWLLSVGSAGAVHPATGLVDGVVECFVDGDADEGETGHDGHDLVAALLHRCPLRPGLLLALVLLPRELPLPLVAARHVAPVGVGGGAHRSGESREQYARDRARVAR